MKLKWKIKKKYEEQEEGGGKGKKDFLSAGTKKRKYFREKMFYLNAKFISSA